MPGTLKKSIYRVIGWILVAALACGGSLLIAVGAGASVGIPLFWASGLMVAVGFFALVLSGLGSYFLRKKEGISKTVPKNEKQKGSKGSMESQTSPTTTQASRRGNQVQPESGPEQQNQGQSLFSPQVNITMRFSQRKLLRVLNRMETSDGSTPVRKYQRQRQQERRVEAPATPKQPETSASDSSTRPLAPLFSPILGSKDRAPQQDRSKKSTRLRKKESKDNGNNGQQEQGRNAAILLEIQELKRAGGTGGIFQGLKKRREAKKKSKKAKKKSKKAKKFSSSVPASTLASPEYKAAVLPPAQSLLPSRAEQSQSIRQTAGALCTKTASNFSKSRSRG